MCLLGCKCRTEPGEDTAHKTEINVLFVSNETEQLHSCENGWVLSVVIASPQNLFIAEQQSPSLCNSCRFLYAISELIQIKFDATIENSIYFFQSDKQNYFVTH